MMPILQILMIARRQWRWLVTGILLGVLVIMANTLLMALSGWFIASMAVAGVSGIPFNYFTPSGGIRFLAILRTVGRYSERLITHEAAFRFIADLRVWLYEKIEPLAPAGLEQYAGGDVAGRLRADVDAMESIYLRIAAPLAVGALTIAAALFFLIYYSPPSAVAMLIFLLGTGVWLPLLVRRKSELPGKRSAELAAELRIQVTEGLQGVEELVLLGAVERQADVVEDLSARLVLAQEQMGRINGLGGAGMVCMTGCAAAVILLTGSSDVFAGRIPPPSLVMLLLFSAAIFEAVAQFPSALHLIPAARESACRIISLATSPVPVPDPLFPLPVPGSTGISFKGVSGSYLADRPVLHGFSLEVPEGSRVALTGISGSGKSLLFEILLRFRDYDGSITIGGVELRSMTREAIMNMISAVPQRPHLFNATIRENILLGDLDADERDLQQVLIDSGLSAWVAGLPQGLDTPVGINGSEVSGGEARRIALARSLMKKAPILLLDEPTEGLDAVTEREVVARLHARTRGVTLLVISHRPACLELGDKVVRLQKM